MPSTQPPAARLDARPGRPPCWVRFSLSVLLSAGFAGAAASAAEAQVAAPMQQQAAAPDTDVIKQREQELEAARAQQRSAADQREKLKADIAAIGLDRSKLNGQL